MKRIYSNLILVALSLALLSNLSIPRAMTEEVRGANSAEPAPKTPTVKSLITMPLPPSGSSQKEVNGDSRGSSIPPEERSPNGGKVRVDQTSAQPSRLTTSLAFPPPTTAVNGGCEVEVGRMMARSLQAPPPGAPSLVRGETTPSGEVTSEERGGGQGSTRFDRFGFGGGTGELGQGVRLRRRVLTLSQLIAVGDGQERELTLFGRSFVVPARTLALAPVVIGQIFEAQHRIVFADSLITAHVGESGDRVMARRGSTGQVVEIVDHQESVLLSSGSGTISLLVTTDSNTYMNFSKRRNNMRGFEDETAGARSFREVAQGLIAETNCKTPNTIRSFQEVKEYLRGEVVAAIERSGNLARFSAIYEAYSALFEEALVTLQFGKLALKRVFDEVLKDEYKLRRGMSKEEIDGIKSVNKDLCMALLEWHNLYTTAGSICMLGAGSGNGEEAQRFYRLPRQLLEMVLVGRFELTVDGRAVPVTFERITTFSERESSCSSATPVTEKVMVLKCTARTDDPDDQWIFTSPFAIALRGSDPDVADSGCAAAACAASAAAATGSRRLPAPPPLGPAASASSARTPQAASGGGGGGGGSSAGTRASQTAKRGGKEDKSCAVM